METDSSSWADKSLHFRTKDGEMTSLVFFDVFRISEPDVK
jgi:hypothetical protein